jgi:hypothetical protein
VGRKESGRLEFRTRQHRAATCIPSDLDPIAGGLGAAAMPTQNVDGMDQSVHAQKDEDEKEKKKAKDENGDDERKKR